MLLYQNHTTMNRHVLYIVLMVFILASCKHSSSRTAQQTSDSSSVNNSEKLPPPNPEKNCYFGDLHLHTVIII